MLGIKKTHQVLADGLLVFNVEGMPINVNKLDPFKEHLVAVSYAVQSSHQLHGQSPAQLLFGCDMFLPV